MIPRLVENMLGGDRRALARLFSLLDRDSETLASIMRATHPNTGRAYCVGVTGPPGAGKSTIVDHLVQILRGDGVNVGVLAVDPTSPFTGGAVLGDRIRMRRHYLDQGVFIRSLGTRGVHGGLSRIASGAVKLLDAFGKDMIIVETIGVGQTELDIMKVADTVVVVLVPEAGDAVQAMKAGLVEIADVFVVNKADRQGADRLAASIETTLSLDGGESSLSPRVLMTQAHRGEGVQALYDAILEHRSTIEGASHLEQRRRERRKHEFAQTLREVLESRIARLMSKHGALSTMATRVENDELDPYSASAQVLDDGQFFSELAQMRQARRPADRRARGGRQK